MKISKEIKQAMILVLFAGFMLVGANYIFADWTAAPGNPPSNNAPAPINVSSASQSKDGALTVKGLGVFGLSEFRGPVSVTKYTSGVEQKSGTLNVDGTITGVNLKGNRVDTGYSLVSGSAIVGGGNIVPKYTLDLRGDTNIGLGKTCKLTATEMSGSGCPAGSYLYSTNTSGDSCRFFDPTTTGSGAYCYQKATLSASIVSPSKEVSIDQCTYTYNYSATSGGGVDPKSYSWSIKVTNRSRSFTYTKTGKTMSITEARDNLDDKKIDVTLTVKDSASPQGTANDTDSQTIPKYKSFTGDQCTQ